MATVINTNGTPTSAQLQLLLAQCVSQINGIHTELDACAKKSATKGILSAIANNFSTTNCSAATIANYENLLNVLNTKKAEIQAEIIKIGGNPNSATPIPKKSASAFPIKYEFVNDFSYSIPNTKMTMPFQKGKRFWGSKTHASATNPAELMVSIKYPTGKTANSIMKAVTNISRPSSVKIATFGVAEVPVSSLKVSPVVKSTNSIAGSNADGGGSSRRHQESMSFEERMHSDDALPSPDPNDPSNIVTPTPTDSTDTTSTDSSSGALGWLKQVTDTLSTVKDTVATLKGTGTSSTNPPPATATGLSPMTIALIAVAVVGIGIALYFMGENNEIKTEK